MIIYTGYFAKLKVYRNEGLYPISIARFNPRYASGIYQYLKLAPTAAMLKMADAEYQMRFDGILKGLRVRSVVEELKHISAGKDVVLLCYESLGKFCHRHTVAEWFRRNGVEVVEYLRNIPPPDEGPRFEQGCLF